MNCHCWGVSFGKPDFIFFVGKWEPELYKMEENVLKKLCSKAKLDRDKGLQDLEELLKQFDKEHVQNLEKHFSATLSDPNAEWETKHGALMGSKAICQTPFCSEEFSSYLIDQALLLADDSEFRVRIASGRCLPSYSCTPAPNLRVICISSCRTATLDFFFDLAESKVEVFLCSILTSDGVPFCFGKNSFP